MPGCCPFVFLQVVHCSLVCVHTVHAVHGVRPVSVRGRGRGFGFGDDFADEGFADA